MGMKYQGEWMGMGGSSYSQACLSCMMTAEEACYAKSLEIVARYGVEAFSYWVWSSGLLSVDFILAIRHNRHFGSSSTYEVMRLG